MKNLTRRCLTAGLLFALSAPAFALTPFENPQHNASTWIQLLMDVVRMVLP